MASNSKQKQGQFIKPRKRWLRWVIEALIILGLIFAFRAWHQRSLVAGEAPVFMAQSLSGEQVQLDSYLGNAILLHFWMMNCPMCELEQDSVSAIAEDYAVITIVAHNNNFSEIEAYMHEQGIRDWITIVDTDGLIHQKYGVVATPTNYIIDANGKIRFREVGLSSGWGLNIRMWLAEAGW